MSGPYDGSMPAIRTGRFASLLEEGWSCFFDTVGWPSEYIGDRVSYADFVIQYSPPKWFYLEVKPQGWHAQRSVNNDPFIKEAIERFEGNGIRQAMLTWGDSDFVWYCEGNIYGPIPVKLITWLSILQFAVGYSVRAGFELPQFPVVEPQYTSSSAYMSVCLDWIDAYASVTDWKPIAAQQAFSTIHSLVVQLKRGDSIDQSVVDFEKDVRSCMWSAGCRNFLHPYLKERCVFSNDLSVHISELQNDFDAWSCSKSKPGKILYFGQHARRQEEIRCAMRDIGIKMRNRNFCGVGLRGQNS